MADRTKRAQAPASVESGQGVKRAKDGEGPESGGDKPVSSSGEKPGGKRGGARAGAGRPSKLTPELADEIAKAIRDGVHPEVAAGAAGIDRATFFRWVAGDAEFATLVARAKDEAEVALVRTTRSGDGAGVGFGEAKAALEVLARSRPQRWAQRVNIKVEEELSVLLDVLEEVLPREWYLKALEAIDARRNGIDAVLAPPDDDDDDG